MRKFKVKKLRISSFCWVYLVWEKGWVKLKLKFKKNKIPRFFRFKQNDKNQGILFSIKFTHPFAQGE